MGEAVEGGREGEVIPIGMGTKILFSNSKTKSVSKIANYIQQG